MVVGTREWRGGLYSHASSRDSPGTTGSGKSHGERVDIARVVGLMPIPEEVNSREANVG